MTTPLAEAPLKGPIGLPADPCADGAFGQDRFHVSEGAVRNHVSRSMAKLQANDEPGQ